MIIKDEDAPDRGIINAKLDGDLLRVTHVQDLDMIKRDLKLRQQNQNDNGFSKDRSMRFIGTIPDSAVAINPELAKDPQAALDFLMNEGSEFCLNKVDTGRSGKIIIK